jgi:hypothetical protein
MRLLEDSLSEEVLTGRLLSGDRAVADVDINSGKVKILVAEKEVNDIPSFQLA